MTELPERIWATLHPLVRDEKEDTGDDLFGSWEDDNQYYDTEYIRADLVDWVPVSERLPEKNGCYDVCWYLNNDPDKEPEQDYLEYIDGKWYETSLGECVDDMVIVYVFREHQPLPPIPGEN